MTVLRPNEPSPAASDSDVESQIQEKTDRDLTKGTLEPPDGGSQAWFHAFLLHMVFFNTWGVTNSFGIWQQYYTESLGESQSTIGWIGGVPMFLLFFIGVASGRASDAGYFRHCYYAGVFLQVFGTMMASLSKTYYQILLSQGVCVGIGHGLLFTPGLSVTSSYFKTRRTFAVGLGAAGAATGGMVYPATVHALLNNTNVGFPWTMRIVGFIMLVTQMPGIIGYRPYLPKRKVAEIIDWSAFRQKSWVFFAVGMFFEFWGLYLAFFFLGIFARDTIHLPNSANLVIILNGVGVIGRTIPNLIGQLYVGVMNITILVSIGCVILVLSWAAITDVAGLYTWTIFYGIFAGGMQSLLPAMATQQAPEPDKVGTWTGMTLMIVSFANLTAAAIQGSIIERMNGEYIGAQLFAGISILVGTVCLALSRYYKAGPSMTTKA